MATWNVALVKEQGIDFAVCLVKDWVLNNPGQRHQLMTGMSLRFGCPAVLVGESNRQTFGREDIVAFLQGVSPERLPWRQVILN